MAEQALKKVPSPAQDSSQWGRFELEVTRGSARKGRFYVRNGSFGTPAFMPVGTQASVKGVSPAELSALGTEIVLVNTYHLHLRPGDELIRDLGGIHTFMGWSGPILSDSGGYQVFSLAHLRSLSEAGVVFQSHIDGALVELSPERAVQIQENLGVDIMMVLDECPSHEIGFKEASLSLDRTLRWAERSQAARRRPEVLAFGIVQGGMHDALRRRGAEALVAMGFDGYAIGGLSVGEGRELMRRMTEVSLQHLPPDKPRYLMGVGTPLDIVESVQRGVDMFDCVIPTRSARFGRLYCGRGWINIRNAEFRTDSRPIEEQCDCYACKNFSRAYLSHLVHAQEMLGAQLASIHNLRYYSRLMAEIAKHIEQGTFEDFAARFCAEWGA